MTWVRAFIWLGVLGWAGVALNFLLGWLVRRSAVRLIWALSAGGGLCYLLSRLMALPYWLRVSMDVAGAMAGVYGAVALLAAFLNNPDSLR